MLVTLTAAEVSAEHSADKRLKLAGDKAGGGFSTYRLIKGADGTETYDFGVFRPISRRAPESLDRSDRERTGRSYAELMAIR